MPKRLLWYHYCHTVYQHTMVSNPHPSYLTWKSVDATHCSVHTVCHPLKICKQMLSLRMDQSVDTTQLVPSQNSTSHLHSQIVKITKTALSSYRLKNYLYHNVIGTKDLLQVVRA